MGGNSHFQKLKNGGRVDKTCIFEIYRLHILDCYISKESTGIRVSVNLSKQIEPKMIINDVMGHCAIICFEFESKYNFRQ